MPVFQLPKFAHPDFAFPRKKPVGRVKIDATSTIPRPHHLYGFSKAGRLIDFTGGHHSDPFDQNTKISRNRIVFNGTTGSQIEFPDTSHSGNSSIFCDRAKFTISTVINFTGGTSPGIMGDFTGSSNVSVLLWLDSSGRVNFRTRCAGVLKTINGTANLIDGADHHIIAQYDGANMYLIVDRKVVASTAQTGSTAAGFTGLLAIGSYRAGWSGNVPVGSIDHVAIWWSAPNWEAIAKRRFDFLEPAIPMPYFIPSAGGGTTINASLESITLTEHLSSVALDKSISAALESILLVENQANADLDKNINGSVESIALTALSSTVRADVDTNVSAAQESIQVNELSASISLGSGISAVLESITLAELPCNITLEKNISSSIEAISVSENAAQITLGSNVAAVLEGITLTEHQAGVVLDVAINAAQESITINQLAAMIGLATDIDAVKENITLTESGATLTLDTSISGATEQISLTTFNFTLTSSISTPNQPGLEYTIPISKMGYTIPVSKIHFTFREED